MVNLTKVLVNQQPRWLNSRIAAMKVKYITFVDHIVLNHARVRLE
jgi:hypothetical protein